MIGYFVKAGDLEVGHIFNPYRFAFSTMLDEKLAGKNYSKDLQLILIEYHLEGKFLAFPGEDYKIKPYREKEHSIGVVIGVPYKFLVWPDIEKKKFIVNTTLRAITIVKDNLSQKENFDLEGITRLYTEVEEYSKAFLK
jgi:hypothetical protein